ncbi:glucan endo-1 3-beta-glucosidase, partial [Phtheirospermum japonicum]
AQWCVASQGATDKNLLDFLSFVCTGQISCQDIQPGGPCFDPATVRAHASFILNAYYIAKVDCIPPYGQITTNDPCKILLLWFLKFFSIKCYLNCFKLSSKLITMFWCSLW